VIEVNRKILLTVLMLAAVLLATPLVSAVPGAEKKNEKFEFFQLICSGDGTGLYDRQWDTFRNSEIIKTGHGRGGTWDETTVDLVELTVGEETFDKNSDPYSVDYTTVYDIELLFDNVGVIVHYNIRLTDTVTVFDECVEIGTLVLKISATVDFTVTPPAYKGTVVGYGTGELKGVHLSAVDLGLISPDPLRYARIGTITGWPEQITNS
jgi:hypothetical protein